jgi:glycosyltransferase involved in cell wall biosynthesis
VMRNADAVICISETLRQEAISRGTPSEKISIVPNAVNPVETEPEVSELLVEVQGKIGDSQVVGYIGSLRELEGVDSTADAVSILRKRGVNAKLFALSSESGQSELIAHCEKLGIGDDAIITGPVPHNQVAPFYELIDVFVVSRPDKRVTRLVTPLKPFEAMQAGRALVMSNLPALAEIVEDGKTGRLYPPDNIEKLADIIERLLNDKGKIDALGSAASQWIVENRTWSKVVRGTTEVYQRLVQDSGR